MASAHMSHTDFFNKLSDLFNSTQGEDPASIYLTQKRLSYDTPSALPTASDALADLHPTEPLPILIRATNGKSKKHRNQKVKVSTVVLPGDLEAFYVRYAEVCRAGMLGLRKRDRKGRKKKEKKKAKVDVEKKS